MIFYYNRRSSYIQFHCHIPLQNFCILAFTSFQVSSDIDGSKMGNESEIEVEENYIESAGGYGEDNGEQESASSLPLHEDGKVKGVAESDVEETISSESEEVRKRTIPPPGFGQRMYEIDPLLRNFSGHLDYRYKCYSFFPSSLYFWRPIFGFFGCNLERDTPLMNL